MQAENGRGKSCLVSFSIPDRVYPSFFLPDTFTFSSDILFRSTLSPCVLYFPPPFPRLNRAFPGSLATPLASSDPFIQYSIIRATIRSIDFLRSHSGNPKRHSFPSGSWGYAFSCPVIFLWYSPPLSFIAYPSDLLSPSDVPSRQQRHSTVYFPYYRFLPLSILLNPRPASISCLFT